MELTKEEIIKNAIADLEWAIEFVKEHGYISDYYLSEDEMKIEDMQNSIDRLNEIMLKQI